MSTTPNSSSPDLSSQDSTPENLPANNFSVNLVNPVTNQVSFVPKPLEIRAEVRNSDQPVFQVEYFEADSADGPFRAIGKHYGPEYVIFREYGVEDSGKYIKDEHDREDSRVH